MVDMTANQVYEIVKKESNCFDAIYEDYILELVGQEGLNALKENKLLETCGILYGRQLYVLCNWKES